MVYSPEASDNGAAEDSASPSMEKIKSYEQTSQARKNILMIFVVFTQLVQMIPFGAGINSSLSIAESLGATPIQAVWIAASYPLTQGTFVLIGGRLGAVFGHKNILAVGCVWWVIWSLGSGFSNNIIALSFMRGLTGIGGGLLTPNAVALLGINFPPGRQRNLAMGLFGAMAPVGAAGGSLVSAVFVQLTEWKWIFFFLSMLGFVVYGGVIVTIPADDAVDPDGKVDWIGAYLGVTGLILFNFVWNQAPAVGWPTQYIYILLIVSILHFVGFAFYEAKIASSPILPFNIWRAPSFGLLMLVIFFAFMSLGIFLWYCTMFMINLRHDALIQVGVQFLPLTILGTCAAFIAAWMVPRLPAQAIIGIGCTAMLTSSILLATTPVQQTYWAMLFPALIIVSFTADLIFASSQIIASNAVDRAHQGVAGSLVGTLLTYGMSTGLGFAGTAEVYTNNGGKDVLKGYRSASYLGIGLAAAAFTMGVVFVRMPKDQREGWGEEDNLQDMEMKRSEEGYGGLA